MSYCNELQSECFGGSEQALAIANRLDEAEDLTRQANNCFVERDYATAERLYFRVLAIKKESVGPNHLSVAATLEDLSELYEIQDKVSEARRFYEFSVLVKERVYGSYHPVVSRSMKKLSALYKQTERLSSPETGRLTELMAS